MVGVGADRREMTGEAEVAFVQPLIRGEKLRLHETTKGVSLRPGYK